MARKWRTPFLNFLLFATIAVFQLKAESEMIDTIVCGPTQYKCNSGECIANSYKCNGYVDCRSREDEFDCDKMLCNDTSKFFKCRDGTCISKILTCDDQGDCNDNSDESEELCHHAEIATRKCDEHNEFQCSLGICIPIRDKCDGVKQCLNGKDEDEAMCKSSNITCNGFLCKNGICLNSHDYVCDGTNDCEDGSDEDHCSTNCDLSDSKFLCESGSECISLEKVCNDANDCHDGSDEGNQCEKKKLKDTDPCSDFKCNGKCIFLPNGPTCICEKGFSFNNESKLCEDINECSRYGICSQQCVNNKGSYNCVCAKGFRLNRDNRSCDSMSVNVQLIFTSKKYIKKISLNTNFHELVQQTRRPVGITFDGDYYYWTEVTSEKEAIVKMHVDSTKKEILFTSGLELPEDIAIDWLTKNLYFTDSSRNHIAVCTNDGFFCTELVKSPEMEKVRAIALYPTESLLFWSDWGADAHIGVSYMDGSNAKILISDVAWPNGLTLDWPNGRIYWIDARNRQIESATIQGNDRRVILKDVFKHPFSIAVFGNRLYWSDKGTQAIEYCDKFTGKNHDVLTQGYDIYDVHIFDNSSMPHKNHACIDNPCSHICLLSANNTYTCACPVNMNLTSNFHDCTMNPQAFNLIFGVGSYIISAPHQAFGRHDTQKAFKIEKFNVDRIEYNTEKKSIFIADNKHRVIVEFDLINKESTELVSKDISHVTSMSYDYHANNLYWCDKLKGTIEVYSLNTKKRAIVQHYAGDHKLVAIKMVPSQGEMFIALQSGDHSHIDRQSMNGDLTNSSHYHVIETGLSKAGNFHLAVDEETKKLYWSDSGRRVIEYSNFDGTMRKIFASIESRAPFTLAILGNDLYWSSERSRSWQFKRKDSVGPLKRFQIDLPEDRNDKSNFINIVSGAPRIMSKNNCLFENGGCSDICMSDGPENHVCKCAVGNSFLDKAKKTCIPHKVCDFHCASGECVEASKVCDNTADCLDGSDEALNCTKVCRINEFKCYNGQCIAAHLKCDGNHNCNDESDENDCKFQCDENQLKCPTAEKCVNVTKFCDLISDCPDEYDESEEICKRPCPLNFFKCVSGQCIPQEFECNLRNDCVDGSDEHEKCLRHICEPPMKACRNGFCLSDSMFCDGHQDCEDGYDELNCDLAPTITCDIDEYQCKSNKSLCIDVNHKCDGIKDCPSGEDEKECPSCPAHLFECNNGDCIPEVQRCDRVFDCMDHSDEMNCDKNTPFSIIPEVCSAYRCADGKCLDYSKVCNNINDCDDDEGGKCTTACTETPCNQLCLPTPKGSVCACSEGFKLKSLGDHLCEDINECNRNPCAQICKNTNGSFECLCYDGYISVSDKTVCQVRGDHPKLFFTWNDEIRELTEQRLKTALRGNESIVDFAVDVRREKIIFMYENIKGIFTYNMKSEEIDVMENVPPPKKIVYDWVTENIYVFSRDGYRNFELYVCKMGKKSCVLLKRFGFNEKISVADIDPINRWLFYVVDSSIFFSRIPPKIVKTRLDGSETLIIREESDISALTIDIDSQRVFYVASQSSLQSLDYEGKNKATFLDQSKMLKIPTAISVFASHAYFIDRLSSQLISCKLYDDKVCEKIPGLNIGNAVKLIMTHQVKQREVQNACKEHLCDEICAITDTGKKCLCNKNGSTTPCEEKILVEAVEITTKEIQPEKKSSWFWTCTLVLMLFLAIGLASFFIYRRKKFRSNFNISMYFKNNELLNEFTNSQSKSPSPNRSIYPRVPPTIVEKMGKNYEVINNDSNQNTYENINQMQNLSDDEFMMDVEFQSNSDQTQRLIE